jgi:hypothetical protein
MTSAGSHPQGYIGGRNFKGDEHKGLGITPMDIFKIF